MSEIINSQIENIKTILTGLEGKAGSDDRLFSHVLLKYFFDVNYSDQQDWITDGPNDGGIDFVFYDDEESKVILCQAKYTTALSFEQILTELSKMYDTLQNFRKANTGSYNDRVKKILQNALDRLPDEYADNIEYNIFTTAPLDVEGALRKIRNSQHGYPDESVSIYIADDIEKVIQRKQEEISTVKQEKVKLDEAQNYLYYESDDLEGIMCNILSSSLISLYNKYAGGGLFDLNIRKYIRNKLVDDGVKRTLEHDRENFWFLNNGIIIACRDFDIDGDTVKLYDFSIVNGGQTTTLIGTYKGDNTKEFYVPCKIVATKHDDEASEYFTKIAEATNSQKPIYPRDLKSNSPEMVRLQKWLAQEDIYLGIKRGEEKNKKYSSAIKNDELGQIILSFVNQQPGTSRSGKKKIFDDSTKYDSIFKVNYQKDPNKKAFLLDLIKLNNQYAEIESKLKNGGLNDDLQIEILKNGKQTLFALLGVCYRLVNGDVTEKDIHLDPKVVANIRFEYGSFISNYSKDDYDGKLENLIKVIIVILTNLYRTSQMNKKTTSVSNFMKTDQKYYSEIVYGFIEFLDLIYGDQVKQCYDILKR